MQVDDADRFLSRPPDGRSSSTDDVDDEEQDKPITMCGRPIEKWRRISPPTAPRRLTVASATTGKAAAGVAPPAVAPAVAGRLRAMPAPRPGQRAAVEVLRRRVLEVEDVLGDLLLGGHLVRRLLPARRPAAGQFGEGDGDVEALLSAMQRKPEHHLGLRQTVESRSAARRAQNVGFRECARPRRRPAAEHADDAVGAS